MKIIILIFKNVSFAAAHTPNYERTSQNKTILSKFYQRKRKFL
jgi:hypothetical protein